MASIPKKRSTKALLKCDRCCTDMFCVRCRCVKRHADDRIGAIPHLEQVCETSNYITSFACNLFLVHKLEHPVDCTFLMQFGVDLRFNGIALILELSSRSLMIFSGFAFANHRKVCLLIEDRRL